MAKNVKVTEKQVIECLVRYAPEITKKLNSNKDVVIKKKGEGQLKMQSCNFESID